MRFLKIIALLFVAVSLQAQNTTVILDTTYYEKGYNADRADSVYFLVKEVQFSNGEIDRKRGLVGDTSSVINHGVAVTNQNIDQLRASALNVIYKTERFVKPMLDISNTINTMFGVNIVELSKEQFGPALEGNCTARINGAAPVAGTITKNKAGNYILNAGGISNKQIIPLFGKMIRVLQYPSAGQSTDLYLTIDGGKVYMNETRTLILVVK